MIKCDWLFGWWKDNMCNLSKGIEERGYERGDKHGIESAAKRMIKKGLLTDEEIAEYTGLDISRIKELKAELKISGDQTC